MRELHTQNPEKVNVWAGIIGNHVVRPFFIDGNFSGDNYLLLSQNNVVSTLANLNPIQANPQVSVDVMVPTGWRATTLPNQYPAIHRRNISNLWKGKRGSLDWPAGSPDLTPLHFFYGNM